MAKVYDALKRIEKERAQHTRATNAIPPRGQHLPAESATAGMWKRWLSRKTREPAAPRENSFAPNGVLLQRIEHIAGRLDTFEEQTLKDMPLADIREALKNRYGTGRQNLNIAPGASVPFTIVFDNLPENLGEFTVEAVSSSPGSAQPEGAGQGG